MVRFFQKILNLMCFALAFLWTMLVSAVASPLFFIKPKYGFPVERNFGRAWLWFMAIKCDVHVEGAWPDHGVIASNHSSMFDIPVLASLPLDLRWISKKEVRRIPFVGLVMQAMGCYFVSRDKSGSDVNVMRDVEKGLARGECIVIFPEGTRTRTGELLPFRKGAFRTALQAGVPIYPVAISGTRLIAPPGSLPSRGKTVRVRIGRPFHMNHQTPLEDQIEKFRTEMIRLLAENHAADLK